MNAVQIEALRLIQSNAWDSAHQLIQNYSDSFSCRIHGYLHRIEGDQANARYWYHRAGQDLPDNTLEEELKTLIANTAEPLDAKNDDREMG